MQQYKNQFSLLRTRQMAYRMKAQEFLALSASRRHCLRFSRLMLFLAFQQLATPGYTVIEGGDVFYTDLFLLK